jgi:hypothetical protein
MKTDQPYSMIDLPYPLPRPGRITTRPTTVSDGFMDAWDALEAEKDDVADAADGSDLIYLWGQFLVAHYAMKVPSEKQALEKFYSAWHAVMTAPTTCVYDLAIKARAVLVYREGYADWGSDTFCDDDFAHLKQFFEETAALPLQAAIIPLPV